MKPPLREIEAEELVKQLKSKKRPVVLDVRSVDEFLVDHLEGAVHVPVQELQARAGELAAFKGKAMVCVCEHGQRSSMAAAILSWMGFQGVQSLQGGLAEWREKGHKTVK
ncbi:MAG TPA: rhodanese-like domain-containing protein [Candidatus Diapherotrites archaeon]|uniref:Rhodanese-like domain-containing protein n=1 Tax=Candidatus Iainarchaeum sp. TaxID=3101447 RepID=A0A7J4JGY1_9ARCH|nr:rhodanese-like domain-containing protein [Candidatus Diapherotrites archaeon]HIH16992.1 rhodanese-like domain-containing protein [Candidatus Diapherotrites archaeon]